MLKSVLLKKSYQQNKNKTLHIFIDNKYLCRINYSYLFWLFNIFHTIPSGITSNKNFLFPNLSNLPFIDKQNIYIYNPKLI